MIHITKTTRGADVYRKLSVSEGLNKYEEGKDISDFLNHPFTKEQIAKGVYVLGSVKSAESSIPSVKSEKKKKDKRDN